jgi:phage shock protein PspC (stress-responsive transcriptional regulator)
VVSSIWTVRRSATDAKLAGLCGGVAQHWGVDPLLVRVGCALLALSGGIGLVLYFAGWLFVPVEGRATAPIDDLLGSQARKWSREVWVVLVVVACVAVFAMFGAVTPFGIGPAVILAVIWYFGFYKHRRPRTDRAAGSEPAAVPGPTEQEQQFFSYPGPPTAFTRAADEWRARIEEHTQEQAGAGQQTWTTQPASDLPYLESGAPSSPVFSASTFPAAAEQSRAAVAADRSPDPAEQDHRAAFLAEPDPAGIYAEQTPVVTQPGQLSRAGSPSAKRLLAVALIAVGLTLAGLGAAAYTGAVVPLAGYFAAALLVLGLSLVAATWFGRARGLLPLAIVALVGVLATSAVHTASSRPDMVPAIRSYTKIVDLPASGDSRDVGRLTVDLSRLDLPGDASYQAHVDLGTLTVVVPPKARVRVDYTVDAGAVRLFGANVASGTELHRVVEPEASTTGQPTLDLKLSVDSGTITVRR